MLAVNEALIATAPRATVINELLNINENYGNNKTTQDIYNKSKIVLLQCL
jgi:hypothetical protein